MKYVVQIVHNGQPINTIKAIREAIPGMGLKEAKDAVIPFHNAEFGECLLTEAQIVKLLNAFAVFPWAFGNRAHLAAIREYTPLPDFTHL